MHRRGIPPQLPWRAAAVVCLCALLGVVAATATHQLAGTAHVTALSAAAVLVLTAAMQRGVRSRGWLQIGTGMSCWACAGALATIQTTGQVTVPTVLIGAVYILGLLPMMVGMAALGARLDADRHLTGMLDWALLFTLAFGLMWRLAIEPIALDRALSLTDRTLAALIPAADLALVLLAVRLVTRRALPALSAWLVVTGLALVAASSFLQLAHLRLTADEATRPIVMFVHIVGLGLVAAGAVHDRFAPQVARLAAHPSPHLVEAAPRSASTLVATIASVPPVAIMAAGLLGDRSVRFGPMLVWLAVVVGLGAWRALAVHGAHRRSAEQLTWLAEHDPLTGAYRIHTFLDLLSHGSARERVGTVLALDIDLDEVRAEHGSDITDLVVVETAARLRLVLSDVAVLARPRESEVVAFIRSSDLNRGRAMAGAVRAAMREPVVVEVLGEPVVVRAIVSVGVAQTDGAVIDIDAGVRRATAAMHHAKAVDPGSVAIDAELAGIL